MNRSYPLSSIGFGLLFFLFNCSSIRDLRELKSAEASFELYKFSNPDSTLKRKSLVFAAFTLPKLIDSKDSLPMVEFKRVSGYPWDTAYVYLSQTSKACAALLVEPGEYILTDYTQTSVHGSIRTTAFLKRVTPKKFSIKGNGIYYLGTIRTKFGDLIVESEKEDKDFCIKQFNVEHPEVDWTQSNDLTMSKHYE